MSYKQNCQTWLHSECLTPAERERVSELAKNPELSELYFSAPMTFGTAGLRSVMDMGPGCMNVYTVAHITQAIANLILQEGKMSRGVAVAYDSRLNSRLFAETAASVFAANGIVAYLFDDIRPTPELSFAIRHLGCIAGVNITASHNPKAYNGYKAYWEDGAQISPSQASVISNMAAEIDMLCGAKRMDYDVAVNEGKIKLLGSDFDEFYLSAVLKTTINQDAIAKVADSLKIVYTPLHGAGRRLVPEIMRRIGIKHIYTVDSQMTPDGHFPTVKKPNPEYADVFTDGIAIANQVGSDLVIATDPDADRVGVMCRVANGQFITLTGNQMGALLLDYVISAAKEQGTLTENDYAVKSFVSTDLANRICATHGVKLYEVPTGFKYIGEVIKTYEAEGKTGKFLLGFEESYGYLFGTYARDKDAVGATMMICEMTAWYAAKGMTLGDAIEHIYATYGLYREGMIDIYMEGLSGIENRKKVMAGLRQNPPKDIGRIKVAYAADYASGIEICMADGSERAAALSGLDVLSYTMENGDKVVVRPSGTEPKIKIYLLCHDTNPTHLEQKIAAYTKTANGFCIL